jgi:WXG100 family type VII secretion target
MAPRFSVDLNRMEEAIDRMGTFDTALSAHLDDVDARIGRLHRTWSGDAAEAQRRAHAEWMAAAKQMRTALTTMRSIATTAHDNYAAAVAANVAMWDGL